MNGNSSETPPAPLADRRMSLMVFGILIILIGCLCALFIPLVFFGQFAASKVSGAAPNLRAAVQGGLTYGILAVTFFWLGIGSIKARRWARALLLVISWSWLSVGVLTMILMVFILPTAFEEMMRSNQAIATTTGPVVMPRAPMLIGLIVGGAFVFVFMVLVPGVLVWFYSRKDVKATCEAHDPTPRWTDACPLPVLAASLWMAFGAVMMLLMPFAYNGVAPFFGSLISGLGGTAFFLMAAVIWAYSAWALYRLRASGWWLCIGGFTLFLISSILTFSSVDMTEMYRQMGYPTEQIEQIQRTKFLNSSFILLWSLAFAVPFFGYLLWIKRFFRRSA